MYTQKFWFVENSGKIAQIVWSMRLTNEIHLNLIFYLITRNNCYWCVISTKMSAPFLWWKICTRKHCRNPFFGQVWGNSGKTFRTANICLPLHQWCSYVWLVGHIYLSETLREPQELIISIKILLNDWSVKSSFQRKLLRGPLQRALRATVWAPLPYTYAQCLI